MSKFFIAVSPKGGSATINFSEGIELSGELAGKIHAIQGVASATLLRNSLIVNLKSPEVRFQSDCSWARISQKTVALVAYENKALISQARSMQEVNERPLAQVG